jgi:hypothetical protein
VATTFAHYPDWRSGAGWRVVQRETHAGVQIRRRRHYVPGRQTAGRRALYEATLFASGLTALALRPRPEVIVGTCPTLAGGALAATASAVYRAPFGLIFQDLMGLAAEQSGVAGGSGVASLVSGAEHALARRAAAVAIIAEGFRSYLEAAGVAPGKIVRLRNWTRRTEPRESAGETRARFGWSRNELVCLHGGNMGQKQGLDNLLETAALLRDENVRIVLAGDGNDRKRLQDRARALALRNVDFIELQGPGRWEEIMQASDVLLVNQRPSVADMSLPSKLTSYFAAGRPVVAAASRASETARELEAAGAGYVVPPDNPGAFRDAILAVGRDPAAAESMARQATAYAMSELSSERILAEYERFMETLLAQS